MAGPGPGGAHLDPSKPKLKLQLQYNKMAKRT